MDTWLISCKIFGFQLNYILKGQTLSERMRKEADEMEDNDLLYLLQSEPETGVARFLEQYASMIYSIVSGRTREVASEEDIEECVSDIVFEIFQKVNTIDLEKGSLQAWTAVVSRNRAINLFKKKARERDRTGSIESVESQVYTTNLEQSVINADERRQLLRAVKDLGEPDNTIIIRRYYFGQRSREIATDLGMTVSAVDTRLSRAILKLRSIWGGK